MALFQTLKFKYKNKMAIVNKKRLPTNCVASNYGVLIALQVPFFPNNKLNKAEYNLQGRAH